VDACMLNINFQGVCSLQSQMTLSLSFADFKRSNFPQLILNMTSGVMVAPR